MFSIVVASSFVATSLDFVASLVMRPASQQELVQESLEHPLFN
jgi:hypothetical protein